MRRSLSLVFLVISVVAASCARPAEEKPAAPKEIRIGVVYPLTGALAPTGLDLKYGVELAVEIINNKYPELNLPLAAAEGLPNLGGAKVKPVFGDHYGAPEKGMSETERLITEEKVVAVMGCYQSSVTATGSQAAERLGIPFLNADSTSPTLTRRGFKWFSRTTPDDDIFSRNLFDFLKDIEKQKGISTGTGWWPTSRTRRRPRAWPARSRRLRRRIPTW